VLAVDQVDVVATEEHVVAFAADEDVVGAISVDDVVPTQPVNDIDAWPADEHVVHGVAGQGRRRLRNTEATVPYSMPRSRTCVR
jgi:hypothetical protein